MISKGIQKHFVDGFVVYRPFLTKDKLGGTKEILKFHMNLRGRIRLLNAHERLSADKNTVFKSHRLYCLPTDIKFTDKIEYKGMMYEIIDPDDVQDMNKFLQIDLAISSHDFSYDVENEELGGEDDGI
jgi:hypothetical protein